MGTERTDDASRIAHRVCWTVGRPVTPGHVNRSPVPNEGTFPGTSGARRDHEDNDQVPGDQQLESVGGT